MTEDRRQMTLLRFASYAGQAEYRSMTSDLYAERMARREMRKNASEGIKFAWYVISLLRVMKEPKHC